MVAKKDGVLVLGVLVLVLVLGRAMAMVQSRTKRRRSARLAKKKRGGKEKRCVTTVGGDRGRMDGRLSFPRAHFVARQGDSACCGCTKGGGGGEAWFECVGLTKKQERGRQNA